VPDLTPADEDKEQQLAVDNEDTQVPSITSQTQGSLPAPAGASYLPDEYKNYEPVVEALDKVGIVNPDARLAVLTQIRLEKGLNYRPSSYNYSNITKGSTWTGKTEIRGDKDATGKSIKQEFRVYNSDDEYVTDYVDLLKRLYPKAYEALFDANFDIKKFTSGLVTGVGGRKWATDPLYEQKLTNLFRSNKNK
jgi:hypothetical protein